jgi:dienelactone hydrolase
MTRARVVLAIVAAAVVVAALTPATPAADQPAAAPELIDVRSGALTLRAQVWRPSGSGRFPAVLFNHGSYSTDDPLPPSEPETLGPLFARHGYVFLWLHRQGIGMSSDQGTADGDQMARAFRSKGA